MPRAEMPASADVGSDLSEIQALIAGADAAVQEVHAETRAVEEKKIRKKKQVAEEGLASAEFIESLLQEMSASDPTVGVFQYEEFFDMAQEETAIAPPAQTKEMIRAMREAHAAIERFEKAPINEKVAAAIKQLIAKRAALYERIRKTAFDYLERIQKKYKGEKDELETLFAHLQRSPLARGFEYDANSPEARVEALRQELRELMLRPVMDHHIHGLQAKANLMREGIEPMQKKLQAFADRSDRDAFFQSDAHDIVTRYGLRVAVYGGQYAKHHVEQAGWEALEQKKKDAKSFEEFVATQRIGVETNAYIIERALEGDYDEAALREALTELRNFLTIFRSQLEKRVFYLDGNTQIPEIKNPLARKLLGQFLLFGVALGGVPYDLQRHVEHYEQRWDPSSQLLGEIVDPNNRGTSFGERLRTAAETVYDQDALGIERSLNLWLRQNPFDPANVAALLEYAKEEGYLAEGLSSEQAAQKFLAGRGDLLNNRFAYEAVTNQNYKIPALPKSLQQGGWIASRSGAWVEPGQDPVVVEQACQARKQVLSKPLADSEFAFDALTPDGKFRIFTTRQAADLLARVRRDAAQLVKDIAVMKKETEAKLVEAVKSAKETAREGLQQKIADLQNALREKEESLRIVREQSAVLETSLAGEKTKTGAAKKEAKSAQDELAKRDKQLLELMAVIHAAAHGGKGAFGGKLQANVDAAITVAETVEGNLPPELARKFRKMTEEK